MSFGKANEIKESTGRRYFTGVENFKVIAVNPSKAELEAIYGSELKRDPEYLSDQTVSDTDGEREVKQVRFDFFLESEGDENIKTRISFYVSDTHHKSQSGKIKVINDFGGSTWLTQESIDANEAPGNMSWYNMSGVKIAKRGEEEVIDFLKNLLNLPMKLENLENVAEAHAKFSDNHWKEFFSGDFSYLKDVVKATNNKIGVLLGVKTKADGGMVQSVYNRKTLRQYSLTSKRADKFKWLDQSVQESKANGAFGNVEFGAMDYTLREFELIPTQLSLDNMPSVDDVFGGGEPVAETGDDFDF